VNNGDIVMTVNTISLSSLVLFLICLSMQSVLAGAGMSEEQMQQMMKQAEKMQTCMGNIDQSALEALEAKSKKMQTEVKALCQAGKRDKAQSTAMKYGKEMASSKELQAMKKCGEMGQHMMPMMTPEQMDKSGHVCDSM